jgi:nitroimidazol reductase NimA-like FMN-containing flavoprotein (pyridoxamine 5'-phosphate oxidase superfamily)
MTLSLSAIRPAPPRRQSVGHRLADRDGSSVCIETGSRRCDSGGEADRVLHRGTLVYVAIGTTRGPLVTPVLYGITGDRVWFLTNRHALKAKVLRRDPRAAWVVPGDGRAAVMTGVARLLSPLHPVELLAAAPRLPSVQAALASWAARNPRQVAGFLRDSLTDPARAMPQDQVLVELQPDTVDVVDYPTESAPRTRTAQDRLTIAVPEALRPLLTQRAGVLAVSTESGPLAVPVRWTPERGLAHLPKGHGEDLSGDHPACLTIDEPVHGRPTEQRGVVLRGHARLLGHSTPVSVHVDRITYWDGFTTNTVDIPATK